MRDDCTVYGLPRIDVEIAVLAVEPARAEGEE